MPAMSAPDDQIADAEPEEMFAARFHMRDDGTLSNATAEKLAIILAEGDPDIERPFASKSVWAAAGGNATPGSEKYKRKLLKVGAFRRRLEDLVAERRGLELDPIWGEAVWMINQGYRQARAEGDSSSALKFTEMRLRVAEKYMKPAQTGQMGAESAPIPAENPVGAPVTPSISNDSDATGGRAKMMGRLAPADLPPATALATG